MSRRALSEPKKPESALKNVEDVDSIPLVGRSPAMQDIYRVLARLMQTDLTVMIAGESGTGKELVARALHDYGQRRSGPFVAINMAAIPRDLIESELFGHERAPSPARNARSAGRFEQAESGTLFLDEIGDMPMEAQTRLLRVLQQGEYTTVGGRTPIKTDVRIVAATNKDLRILIQQGLFREDLFFRLNVVPLRLPPLRERTEDVPDLVRHFFTAGRARRPAAQADRRRRARPAEALSLAGQCARAGEPRFAASPRSIRRRSSPPPSSRRSCRRRFRPRHRRKPAATRRWPPRWSATSTPISAALARRCRRPGSITASSRTSNIRCFPRGLGGNARQPDQGSGTARAQPQHAAQEDPGSRHPDNPHQPLSHRLVIPTAAADPAR